LGRLKNYYLFPVPPEPKPTLANIPSNTETKETK